jgi:hypothetical protein
MLFAVVAGQAQLRGRASFDGAVSKLVETVDEARTDATSGVNDNSSPTAGTGGSACTGGNPGQYVFAGVEWKAKNAPNSPITLTFYKAGPTDPLSGQLDPAAVACAFETQTEDLGTSDISIQSASVGGAGGKVLFVRTNSGSLAICPQGLVGAGVTEAVFAAPATCTPGNQVIMVQDAEGHTAQITIDQSGLAARNS